EVDEDLNAVIQTGGAQVKQELQHVNREAPFAGVPFYLKDVSQTIEGEVSTAGSKLLKDAKASHTANLVTYFHQAGLVSLGYTAAPEFAMKNIPDSAFHGPTENPWNRHHPPGRSS